MEQVRPFPIVYNLADRLEGYKVLERLGSSHAHIVPGHDPLVLQRYPAPRSEPQGIAARLDVEPIIESSASLIISIQETTNQAKV